MSAKLASGLIAAALVSAIAVNTAAIAQWRRPAAPIEGCASVAAIVAAEAFLHGPRFKDAREFRGPDALFLSRMIGMAYPGVSRVVVVAYSDGSAAILSLVGAPECWRAQRLVRP